MTPTQRRNDTRQAGAGGQSRGRRLAIRVVVWVLFAAVGLGGASFAAGDAPLMSKPDGSVLTLGEPVVTSVGAASAISGDLVASKAPPGMPPIARLGDRYQEDGSEINLLPAWRWKGDTSLYSNYGSKDGLTGKPVMSVLASMMFSLASFIWGILLEVVKIGLSYNMVDTAARAINAGFIGLTNTLQSSGLVWVLFLMAAVVAAKAVLKGDILRVAGVLIAIVIPVAATHALADNAADGIETSKADYRAPKGSPAWIAGKGVGYVTEIGTFLGSGFGLTTTIGGAPEAADAAANAANPNCVNYINTLYDQYSGYLRDGAAFDQADPTGATGGAAPQTNYDIGNMNSLKTVSYLWQRSFLANWEQAQFNDPAYGSRMSCHFLERANDVSPIEQAQLAGITAGYPDQGTSSEIARATFELREDKALESQMFGWAACEYDVATSSWSVNPAWAKAGEAETSDCDVWRTKGGGDLDKWEWGKRKSLVESTEGTGDEIADGNLITVRHTVFAFWGHNAGERLLSGLITLITSGIYAYALGGLAIGSVIAQLGLVIMLILLPATLLMLAMPSKTKGRSEIGKKMLKLTGGFFLGKLTLTVVMVLLLQSIVTLEAIFNDSNSGLINMIIPLGALFLLKKLLTMIGVGNLTSISGAVGMSSAAALAATGDQQLQRKGMAAIGNATNKVGLDRADRATKAFARRHTTGHAIEAGAWAGAKSGEWASTKRKRLRLAERTGIADVRNRAIGRKDEDGNYTAFGALQRMSSISGLAGMIAGADVDEDGKRVGTRRGFHGGVGKGLLAAAGWATAWNPEHADKADMAAQALANRKALWLTGNKAKQRRRIAAWGEVNTEQMVRLSRSRELAKSITSGELPSGIKSHRDGTLTNAAGELITAGRVVNGALVAGTERTASDLIHTRGAEISALVNPTAALPAGLQRGDDDYIRDTNKNIITGGTVNAAGALVAGTTSTSAHGLLNDEELVAAGVAGAKKLGISPEQVVIGRRGTPAMFELQQGNADGTGRVVRAKTVEQSGELAKNCLNYLPEHQKKIIANSRLDSTAKQELLTNIAIAVGGMDATTGATVDWAAAYGIHLDTDEGRAELALELAGADSKFSKIEAKLSDVEFTALLGSAKKFMSVPGRDQGPKAVLGEMRKDATAKIAIEVTLDAEEAESASRRSAALKRSQITHGAQLVGAQRALEVALASLAQARAAADGARAQEQAAANDDDLVDAARAFTVQMAAAVETAQETVVASQAKVVEGERKNREIAEEMIEAAGVAFGLAGKVVNGAMALELSSDLAFHDRKPDKIAIGTILDKQDDWEKDFKKLTKGWEVELEQAKVSVAAAQDAGDHNEIKRALEALTAVTAKFAKVAKDGSSKAISANANTLQDNLFEQAATARTGRQHKLLHAKDVVGGGSDTPFP